MRSRARTAAATLPVTPAFASRDCLASATRVAIDGVGGLTVTGEVAVGTRAAEPGATLAGGAWVGVAAATGAFGAAGALPAATGADGGGAG